MSKKLTSSEDTLLVSQGQIKLTIRLNGTDKNPYSFYELTGNPFPSSDEQKLPVTFRGAYRHLLRLGEIPIPDTDYIRNYLKGYSDEFISLCCSNFRKGEIVEFSVIFPLE